MSQICIRCKRGATNFPKPSNKLVCGSCLHDIHENFRAAEEALGLFPTKVVC